MKSNLKSTNKSNPDIQQETTLKKLKNQLEIDGFPSISKFLSSDDKHRSLRQRSIRLKSISPQPDGVQHLRRDTEQRQPIRVRVKKQSPAKTPPKLNPKRTKKCLSDNGARKNEVQKLEIDGFHKFLNLTSFTDSCRKLRFRKVALSAGDGDTKTSEDETKRKKSSSNASSVESTKSKTVPYVIFGNNAKNINDHTQTTSKTVENLLRSDNKECVMKKDWTSLNSSPRNSKVILFDESCLMKRRRCKSISTDGALGETKLKTGDVSLNKTSKIKPVNNILRKRSITIDSIISNNCSHESLNFAPITPLKEISINEFIDVTTTDKLPLKSKVDNNLLSTESNVSAIVTCSPWRKRKANTYILTNGQASNGLSQVIDTENYPFETIKNMQSTPSELFNIEAANVDSSKEITSVQISDIKPETKEIKIGTLHYSKSPKLQSNVAVQTDDINNSTSVKNIHFSKMPSLNEVNILKKKRKTKLATINTLSSDMHIISSPLNKTNLKCTNQSFDKTNVLPKSVNLKAIGNLPSYRRVDCFKQSSQTTSSSRKITTVTYVQPPNRDPIILEEITITVVPKRPKPNILKHSTRLPNNSSPQTNIRRCIATPDMNIGTSSAKPSSLYSAQPHLGTKKPILIEERPSTPHLHTQVDKNIMAYLNDQGSCPGLSAELPRHPNFIINQTKTDPNIMNESCLEDIMEFIYEDLSSEMQLNKNLSNHASVPSSEPLAYPGVLMCRIPFLQYPATNHFDNRSLAWSSQSPQNRVILTPTVASVLPMSSQYSKTINMSNPTPNQRLNVYYRSNQSLTTLPKPMTRKDHDFLQQTNIYQPNNFNEFHPTISTFTSNNSPSLIPTAVAVAHDFSLEALDDIPMEQLYTPQVPLNIYEYL